MESVSMVGGMKQARNRFRFVESVCICIIGWKAI